MKQDNVVAFETPQENEEPLTELLCSGAKRLIQQAVEAELGELLSSYEGETDELAGPRWCETGICRSVRW